MLNLRHPWRTPRASRYDKADDIEVQNPVPAFFRSTLSYWSELYDGKDAYRRTYVERKDAVLEMVDRLALPPHSRILDIGCGPGLITLALAQRGYRVAAADLVFDMVRAAVGLTTGASVDCRVTPSVGDVRRLPFSDESFDLVLAIGVTEWLPNLRHALREIARVVKRGGFVIVSADNRWTLHGFLDPLLNPIAGLIKEILLSVLYRVRRRVSRVRAKMYSIHELDLAVSAAGLEKLVGRTLGFEPFSFLRRPIMPDLASLRVHQALQRLADRQVPIVKSAGRVYLLLATKGADRARWRVAA
jgi:SAM-dependent methyltransferase